MELLYNLDQTNRNGYLSPSANIFPLSKSCRSLGGGFKKMLRLENYALTPQSLSLTYESWAHTLRDLGTYSPYAIDGCHLRLLFIVYQLLKAISFIHRRGLSTGPVQLTDIHINDRFWVQLKPRFHSCLAAIELLSDGGSIHAGTAATHQSTDDDYRGHSLSQSTSRTKSDTLTSTSTLRNPSLSSHEVELVVSTATVLPSPWATVTHSPVYHVEQRYETYCRTQIDIVELIKQWQLGHISNFDYLLILNALAGRRFHDPNYHLIFPWINDFTSPINNLRDLSQSKYRLNKGSFSSCRSLLAFQTPHVLRLQETLNSI